MKIKTILVSKDEDYFARLKSRTKEAYAGKIKLYVFDSIEEALRHAKEIKPDILLREEDCDCEAADLPKRCVQAVLIDEKGIASICGVPAIMKYQSTTDLIADLMELFARKAEDSDIRFAEGGGSTKQIITFFPAAGGVGSSTLAAAYALSLAESGRTVLYLNLETFGTANTFFPNNSKNGFDQVLYALQMNNQGSAIRLTNALSRDVSGVCFYSAASSAVDMQELDAARIELLFDYLAQSTEYDWIVTDMDFSLDSAVLQQIMRSDATVFVSDGSAAANAKLKRVSDAMENLLSQDFDGDLFLMYNRFSSKNGVKATNTIFKEIGGVNRIEDAEPYERIQIMSKVKGFRDLTMMVGGEA